MTIPAREQMIMTVKLTVAMVLSYTYRKVGGMLIAYRLWDSPGAVQKSS